MSELNRDEFEDLVALADAYLRDEIDAGGYARLESMLADGPEAAKAFAEYLAQVGMMREVLAENSHSQSAASEPELHEYLSILSALEPREPLDPVVLSDGSTPRRPQNVAARLASIGTLPGVWAWGGLAVAAGLAIAVTLAVVFFDSPQPPTNQTTQSPQSPDAPRPSLAVATLTAEHDAQWAERSIARGTELHQGDHLTLTAGFAEITTAKGAVVILQAPAKIELLDSDNAVRLVSGKLVGLCHTDTSKGFVVKTAHADTTDLGTEFGVEAGPAGTSVAVFQGEVQVTAATETGPSTRSARLVSGFGAHFSSTPDQRTIEPVALTPADENRFARSLDDAMDPGLAYRRAVLASKPLVYWGFDEGENTTANLAGRSDWDGQAIGQSDHAQGLFGSAIKLTGEVDTMGGIASAIPLTFTHPDTFTLEAWYFADSRHFGRLIGLSQNDIANADSAQHLNHLAILELFDGDDLPKNLSNHRGEFRFTHRSPPGSESVTGVNLFTRNANPDDLVGRWVHVVAVKDGPTLRLYLDGKLAAELPDNQPGVQARVFDLLVGVSAVVQGDEEANTIAQLRPFHGRIDELAVYDTALPAQSIQHHFLLGRPSEGD